MHKKLFLIASFLFYFSLSAQTAQQVIDNLKIDLGNNPDAKKKATIYSDLTWYYSKVSIDSALVYGGKALESAKKLGDSTLLSQVYSDIGTVYFAQGNFINSKDNFLKSYKIRKARNDAKGVAKINNNLANVYERTFQYKKAMSSFLEALQYFESTNDFKNINVTKGNIGLVLFKLKNYPKAIKYLKSEIKYEETNKLPEGLCVSCLNIGNVYLKMRDTINALKFYDKSLKACTEIGNNKGISIAYSNIGSVKSEQKKSKDAIALYAKSNEVGTKLNSDIDKASLQLKFAKELIDTKKYADAQQILTKIKTIFEKQHSNENLILTYKLLNTTHAYLKNPDSVVYYTNQYIFIKDKLLDVRTAKQSQELETKYQTEKKEKLLLQKEIEVKKASYKLLAVSSVALFVGLIGFLIYRQQKLKNKQQQQEFQLKSAIKEIETQNKLQEQRLSISRDLHDNIGAQLTFVISSVDNLKFGNQITDTKINNQLTKISDFTKSTIVELRDTIWAMNNNDFSFDDLRSRIFNFIEKAKTAKENVTFNFDVDASLREQKFSSIIGINLYRTIQEAINNALKYSDADSISVKVASQDKKIKIEIQDNGKGFNIETVAFGNGLNNMVKRIEEIDGSFEIDSHEKQGTTIHILIAKTV